jgi:hypothetical protein
VGGLVLRVNADALGMQGGGLDRQFSFVVCFRADSSPGRFGLRRDTGLTRG